MKEKEPTKLRGKKQGTTTTNVGEAKVPAQDAKQRGITLVAVSYTHLDVYKRQLMRPTKGKKF